MAFASQRNPSWLLAAGFMTTSLLLVDSAPALECAQPTIAELIENLNADTFAEREAAQQQLFKIGEPALPQLRDAAKNGPPETRFRASAIVRLWEQNFLVRGFTELGKHESDAEVDVEHGMFLIARIVDSGVEKATLIRQLDDLAAKVQSQVGDETIVKNLPPHEAVDAIRKVLFTDLGFTGNQKDYDNPVNSSLDVVLKTRQGLPILLSHVVVSVAQRLEVPIVGIGISGRYMCKYHGADAPGGPQPDIVIDPFGGGRKLTPEQLADEINFFDPDEDLQPHANRATLLRMMTNLASDFDHVGRHRDALRVRSLQLLLSP